MRIRRGSLASEKDSDGHVWVWVNTNESPPNSDETETSQVTSWELIEQLRSENHHLRQQVEDWKEESRRKDTIIYELVHNMPELPAGEAPTERPQSHTADAEDVFEDQPEEEFTEAHMEPQQSRRPWWRRIFGR